MLGNNNLSNETLKENKQLQARMSEVFSRPLLIYKQKIYSVYTY